MAYNPKIPPRLIVGGGIDRSESGCAIFAYSSPTDSLATIAGANYFSNGVLYNMQLGDVLIASDVTNGVAGTFYVSGVTGFAVTVTQISGSGGGTPGGSNLQVQYNNSGVFAGYTPTQLTALLNNFTSLLAGVVPASGGGTVNFLRADGDWAPAVSPSTVETITTGTSVSGVVANTTIEWNSSTSSPKTVGIVAATAGNTGLDIVVKDSKGDAGSNNITITPASGTIDGAANIIIAANFNALTLRSNGAGNWMVV